MPTIHSNLLGPVVALVIWTLLIWVWMYLTRLPAIRRTRLKLDPTAVRGEQMAQLPPKVRWKADNYNHLLEQPTIFYPLVLALVLLGDQSASSLYLAWGYVVLRVIHSLWQALVNVIEVRFVLFSLSSLCLFGLSFNAARLLWWPAA
jgi:hypothetical protein